MKYTGPVNEVPAAAAAVVYNDRRYRQLRIENDELFRENIAEWVRHCTTTHAHWVRARFGTPLFPEEWDETECQINDDEAYVLLKMGWYNDAADHATRLGFANVKQFAKKLEFFWRVSLASRIARPPSAIRDSWKRLHAQYMA